MAEVVDFMNGKINLPEKSVAITFDDGWKDNIVAAQMLAERGMSATFYVLSGAFGNSVYLSKDDVKELSKNRKFEIGAHSHTHYMQWVGNMDQADERVIIGEMIMSKIMLEEIIGKSVNSFAWPFGYSRQNALKKAPAMGFTSTVHVNAESKNIVGGNTNYITRINIDGGCNAEHLKTILETGLFVQCK
jgi:peptidoglycan/xylan/chitin deacetylase (PgdA/CDA1 family)